MNLGVLEECVKLLHAHLQEVPLLRPAAALLTALAGNDGVKQRLCEARAPALCAALLGGHTDSPAALEATTGLLAMLTTRHTENCVTFVEAGGIEALMGAMRAAPAHVLFIKKGCLAARNLAVRYPECVPQFMEHGAPPARPRAPLRWWAPARTRARGPRAGGSERGARGALTRARVSLRARARAGGEAVLRDAMGRTAELHDEAKAALRDMHCDVSLAQPWKGLPGEEHILERGDANGEDRFAQYLDTDEARAAMREAGFDTSQMC